MLAQRDRLEAQLKELAMEKERIEQSLRAELAQLREAAPKAEPAERNRRLDEQVNQLAAANANAPDSITTRTLSGTGRRSKSSGRQQQLDAAARRRGKRGRDARRPRSEPGSRPKSCKGPQSASGGNSVARTGGRVIGQLRQEASRQRQLQEANERLQQEISKTDRTRADLEAQRARLQAQVKELAAAQEQAGSQLRAEIAQREKVTAEASLLQRRRPPSPGARARSWRHGSSSFRDHWRIWPARRNNPKQSLRRRPSSGREPRRRSSSSGRRPLRPSGGRRHNLPLSARSFRRRGRNLSLPGELQGGVGESDCGTKTIPGGSGAASPGVFRRPEGARGTQSRRTQLQAQLSDLARALEEARQELQEERSRRERSEKQNERLPQEIGQVKRALQESQAKRFELEAAMTARTAEMEKLVKQVCQEAAERERLQARQDGLELELAELKRAEAKWQRQRAELEEQVQLRSEAMEKSDQQLQKELAARKVAEAENLALQQAVAEAKRTSEEIGGERARLGEQVKELSDALEETKAHVLVEMDERAAAEKEKKQLEQDVGRLKRAAQELRTQRGQLIGRLKDNSDGLSRVRSNSRGKPLIGNGLTRRTRTPPGSGRRPARNAGGEEGRGGV